MHSRLGGLPRAWGFWELRCPGHPGRPEHPESRVGLVSLEPLRGLEWRCRVRQYLVRVKLHQVPEVWGSQ